MTEQWDSLQGFICLFSLSADVRALITLKASSALDDGINNAALQLGGLTEQEKAKDAAKRQRAEHVKWIAPPSVLAHSHHKYLFGY